MRIDYSVRTSKLSLATSTGTKMSFVKYASVLKPQEVVWEAMGGCSYDLFLHETASLKNPCVARSELAVTYLRGSAGLRSGIRMGTWSVALTPGRPFVPRRFVSCGRSRDLGCSS